MLPTLPAKKYKKNRNQESDNDGNKVEEEEELEEGEGGRENPATYFDSLNDNNNNDNGMHRFSNGDDFSINGQSAHQQHKSSGCQICT